MAPVPPPPTVISTGTEQSGVEWRNLRPQWHQCLPSHCHFDRNGAKRSGVEKSPAPCCSPIAMGDLSAQSNNRFQTPLSLYRHAAPLEMTCRRPALQSWGKETNDIDTIRPTVISTKALQSGEISGLNGTSASPLPLSFRPKRSKAEWSGEISGPHGTGPIVVGDFSTQRNNRFQTPLPSYRHAAPLEMTYGRAALQSWGKETNDIDTIRPTVISTKALQSGEISGLNGTSASPPTVISTATEQSGVERRNLQPPCCRPIAIGDLGAQSLNGVQIP
jgi:hypothetical protein